MSDPTPPTPSEASQSEVDRLAQAVGGLVDVVRGFREDLKSEIQEQGQKTRDTTQNRFRKVIAWLALPLLFLLGGVGTAILQNQDLKDVQDEQVKSTDALVNLLGFVQDCTTPPEPGSPEEKDPDYCGNRGREDTAKLVQSINVTIIASDQCVAENRPGVQCVQEKYPAVMADVEAAQATG